MECRTNFFLISILVLIEKDMLYQLLKVSIYFMFIYHSSREHYFNHWSVTKKRTIYFALVRPDKQKMIKLFSVIKLFNVCKLSRPINLVQRCKLKFAKLEYAYIVWYCFQMKLNLYTFFCWDLYSFLLNEYFCFFLCYLHMHLALYIYIYLPGWSVANTFNYKKVITIVTRVAYRYLCVMSRIFHIRLHKREQRFHLNNDISKLYFLLLNILNWCSVCFKQQ